MEYDDAQAYYGSPILPVSQICLSGGFTTIQASDTFLNELDRERVLVREEEAPDRRKRLIKAMEREA